MNKKNYIIYEIKRFLPQLIIFAGVYLVSIMQYFLQYTLLPGNGGGGFPYILDPTILYVLLLIIPSLAAFVYPIFVYTYRFSKNGLDIFYQSSVDKKFFRRVKFLIGLIGLISIFVVIYLGSISLFTIAYEINYATAIKNGVEITRRYYSSFYFLLPLFALSIGSIYTIGCFLCSFANNIKDLFVTYISGFVVLSFFGTAFATFLNIFTNFAYDYSIFINPIQFGFMPFIPTIYLGMIGFYHSTNNVLNIFFHTNNIASADLYAVVWFISSILVLALGILSVFHVLYHKERSADYRTIHGGYSWYTKYIVHLAALVIGIYEVCLSNISGSIIFATTAPFAIFTAISYAGIYYLVLALYNKKWTLDKKDLIAMIANDGIIVVVTIIVIISSFIELQN